jgi:hypothetical protein
MRKSGLHFEKRREKGVGHGHMREHATKVITMTLICQMQEEIVFAVTQQ